ncbi:MAG: group II truncated hemoglobin [Bryobacterales bacterium]
MRDPRVEALDSAPRAGDAYLHRAARLAVLLAIPALTGAQDWPQLRSPATATVSMARALPSRAGRQRDLVGRRKTSGESGALGPAAETRSTTDRDDGLKYSQKVPSLYEAAGEREGLLRLADAWHKRALADEIVRHAFSHGYHPQHLERLAAYWSEALGGPQLYTQSFGDETAVVRMHSGNGEHEEMDRRAIACFDRALEDIGLTSEPLRTALRDYFAWVTTTAMARYTDSRDDVPAGLRIPRWSWDGLQS